jgi:hypothetical protein
MPNKKKKKEEEILFSILSHVNTVKWDIANLLLSSDSN